MLQIKTDLCRCVYYKAKYGSLAINNYWISVFHLWLVSRKAGHGGFIGKCMVDDYGHKENPLKSGHGK